MHLWSDRIRSLVAEMPTGTEDEIAWKLIEEMSVKAASFFFRCLRRTRAKTGGSPYKRIPRLYGNADAIVRQALHFHGLARNMIVKIPVTKAGVAAIEEATFQGVSINATVSFSLPQALAVAEAVERGLSRREKLGMDISTMGPVCTIMVGRLDDWLKVLVEKKGIIMTPGNLEWAGVAVMKKAYRSIVIAAIDFACCPPHSATTCTGASSLAVTSSSLPPAPGKSASITATSRCATGWTCRWTPQS